jgi:predicted dehydrogenase
LVHKSSYPSVDSSLYIYAPKGQELQDHLARITSYNERNEGPTNWKLNVYEGEDYLQKMLEERPGNVMMVAGKNDKKIEYILSALGQGIHVYADKPLVIDAEGFQKLKKAFQIAEDKQVLLYDIMTERFEITTLLQRELSTIPSVFGELEDGSPSQPAITKESVHHFFKEVSGVPLVRPDWFFDIEKEGTGIVDVTTHLVDLIQWEAFPEQILDTTEVQVYDSKIWATGLSLEEFQRVTQKPQLTQELKKYKVGDKLEVMSNGEFSYSLRGKHAKVSVIWNFQAPEGTGDTHFSLMRGTKANLIIRQGEAEGFKPVLYVQLLGSTPEELKKALTETLATRYSGLDLQLLPTGEFKVLIPAQYHTGHEAHFAQVTARYLDYLQSGTLPSWEVPNMLTKYYTTTQALRLARKGN